MSSIRLRLLIRLVGPLMLVNLGAAALSYQLAWKPAQRAFDQSLSEAARSVAAGLGPAGDELPPAGSDGVDQTWYALRGADGRLQAGADDLPLSGRPGSVVDGVMRGEPVRVAIVQAEGKTGPARIGVARTVRARTHVRDAIVRTMVALEALVSIVLAAVVWLSVTNGLAPLARLRSRLDGRGSGELEPLDERDLPDELAPVVVAFNDLLDRAAAGARAQHDFQANVAHQLRTPLAGLKLQLEWLAARHAGDPETAASLGLMRQANEKLIRETNQLLALARAEPSHFEQARLEPLDLAALVAESVQAFVDQAVARRIDLGFSLAPAALRGDRFLLRDLLDNLVDNALRYTPAGGSVTVRSLAATEGARLVVEDSGPGIPPAQRGRVFERYVRLDPQLPGSGLGLAIVRDIARVHGATVAIGARDGGGAVFTVQFVA